MSTRALKMDKRREQNQNAKPLQLWRIVTDQGEFMHLEYGPFLTGEEAAIENLGDEETTG